MIPDSTGTQQPTGGPQERISSLRAAILRISGSLGLDTALREIAGSIRCSSAPASSILDTTVGSARYLRADYPEDPARGSGARGHGRSGERRAGGNEVKMKESIHGPGDTESEDPAPDAGRVPEAVRRTEVQL